MFNEFSKQLFINDLSHHEVYQKKTPERVSIHARGCGGQGWVLGMSNALRRLAGHTWGWVPWCKGLLVPLYAASRGTIPSGSLLLGKRNEERRAGNRKRIWRALSLKEIRCQCGYAQLEEDHQGALATRSLARRLWEHVSAH